MNNQEDSTQFLQGFLKVSGILEIFFGIVIIFIGRIMHQLNLPFLPFWHLSFGLSLATMGILLYISGRDLQRYQIIPYISCGYRLILAGFQTYTAITVVEIRIFMILGAIFDIVSPLFILYLLGKNNFLQNEQEKRKKK
ncbi:hypothetical protein NEF87_001911 [Candidatus Lokiarchaeum ossiferum]|uniref:Uncharacterized protein n=1 Tax=Candidatus Lokiarchaeum ossiferum TaxID=2951803 RepID=A0ABY6HQ33_9ARCH|nr:hypothetical protein NEF87_001911 [Candidatus Lokiarchaeum sp. B-35]